MDQITVKARAKINLSLDVLKKREDGYHEIRMIMQLIELHDIISIKAIPRGIQVITNKPWLPGDRRNIAYRAAEFLISRYGIDSGVRISIKKNIPVSAGLAGGSADAAAVLKGINELFNLHLSEEEMLKAGTSLGADVPYCIKGGTVLAEGIGERLTELERLRTLNLVLVKPRVSVSTKWVYENLDLAEIKDRPDIDGIAEAIGRDDIDFLCSNMKNVLETVTARKYGVIGEIKRLLIELGAKGSMMSGSGPTVFGIFLDKQSAQNAFNFLKSKNWSCYLTQTFN